MYDFIKGEVKLSPSENFSTSEVKKIDIQSNGYQHYQLQYLQVLKIKYNDELRILKFEESIPYFSNGHNYHQTKQEFIQAINFISALIGVDIKKAIVKKFEYGKTIKVSHDPITIINNHRIIGSRIPGINNHCKFFFLGGSDYLKMYDAQRNYMYKTTKQQRKSAMTAVGLDLNANYIRIENRYENPLRTFGYIPTINDLISSSFINLCRRNLFRDYKRIKINMLVGYPTTKKDLHSTNICIITMMNLIERQNLDVDIQALILETINSAELLLKNDRDGRKHQFKKYFAQLSTTIKSNIDLSTALIRKIAKDRY